MKKVISLLLLCLFVALFTSCAKDPSANAAAELPAHEDELAKLFDTWARGGYVIEQDKLEHGLIAYSAGEFEVFNVFSKRYKIRDGIVESMLVPKNHKDEPYARLLAAVNARRIHEKNSQFLYATEVYEKEIITAAGTLADKLQADFFLIMKGTAKNEKNLRVYEAFTWEHFYNSRERVLVSQVLGWYVFKHGYEKYLSLLARDWVLSPEFRTELVGAEGYGPATERSVGWGNEFGFILSTQKSGMLSAPQAKGVYDGKKELFAWSQGNVLYVFASMGPMANTPVGARLLVNTTDEVVLAFEAPLGADINEFSEKTIQGLFRKVIQK